MEPVFSGKDLKLIEGLVYNPDLEPGYELLRGCLIWDDERPDWCSSEGALSREGEANLTSLWAMRNSLHLGCDLSACSIDPDYTRDIWERAQKQVPNWPGFKRLTLSQKDKEYLEHEAASEDF